MSKAAPWSFSRIKAFEQCPKQFYHEKVLKQYPFKETDAMRYGTDFHKACEDYIGEGTPIPKKFDFIKPTLDALNRKPGKKIVPLSCKRILLILFKALSIHSSL